MSDDEHSAQGDSELCSQEDVPGQVEVPKPAPACAITPEMDYDQGRPEDGKKRCARFVFTINNYTDVEVAHLKAMLSTDHVVYACYGLEVGEQGTRHVQGCVVFTSARTCAGAKCLLLSTPKRMWMRCMRGTPEQASKYCKKDGTGIFEVGVCPLSKRKFGEIARELLDIGKRSGIRAVISHDAGTFLRYSRGIQTAISIESSCPRSAKPVVLWFHGETGSGKTRCAFDKFGDRGFFKMMKNKWWNGYSPASHDAIILDDLRATHFDYDELLRLFDFYPFMVETKGGEVHINSPTIIVTSPMSPEVMFQSVGVQEHGGLNQLMRRIDKVVGFPVPAGTDVWI